MPRVSQHFGLADPRLQSLVFPQVNVVTNANDSNQTYAVSDVLGGLIIRTPVSARTDTLPSAAALVEAIQGCMVGTSFTFTIRNTSGVTVTLAAGVGGTINGTATAVTVANKVVMIVFTNVTIGSEAYTAYSMGNFAY